MRKFLQANKKRQAIDAIGGYHYQVWHTLLHWLELKDDEVLYVEGSEDVDILGPNSAQVIQIKTAKAPITLHSASVLDAINNYHKCREDNPGHNVYMRFLTTAKRGRERNKWFGDLRGLDVWDYAKESDESLEDVRSFLIEQENLPRAVRNWIDKRSRNELRRYLIQRIEWGTNNRSIDQVQEEVANKLRCYGTKQGVTPANSIRVSAHLLEEIWETAKKQQLQDRALTHRKFVELFARVTQISISTQDYNTLRVCHGTLVEIYNKLQDSNALMPSELIRTKKQILDDITNALIPLPNHLDQFQQDAPLHKAIQKPPAIRPVILTARQKAILAILYVSVYPLTIEKLRKFDSSCQWSKEIKVLIKYGCIDNRKKLILSSHIRNSIRGDESELIQAHKWWIERLTPLKNHPDIALLLSTHLFSVKNHDNAISVIADIVEASYVGQWLRSYDNVLNVIVEANFFSGLTELSQLRVLNSLGISSINAGQISNGIMWLKKLQAYAKSKKSKAYLIIAQLNLGIAHEKNNENAMAELAYRNAVKLAKQAKESRFHANALVSLANCVAVYNPPLSMKLFQEAILIRKNLSDISGLSSIYLAIGWLANMRGSYQEAEHAFQKSIDLAKSVNDNYTVADGFCSLAKYYYDRDNARNALEYYEYAVRISSKEMLDEPMRRALRGIIAVSRSMRHFNLTTRTLKRLAEYERKYGSEIDQLIAEYEIGLTAIEQNDYVNGRRVIQRALALARKLHDVEWIYRCLLSLSNSYEHSDGVHKVLNMLKSFAEQEQKSMNMRVAGRLWGSHAQLLKKRNGERSDIEMSFRSSITALRSVIVETDRIVVNEIYRYYYVWLREIGALSNCLELLDEINAFGKKANYNGLVISTLIDKAAVLEDLGRTEEALKIAQESVNAAKRQAGQESLSTVYNNLGELNRRLGRIRSSIKFFEIAEKIAKNHGDLSQYLSIVHHRALAIAANGDSVVAQKLISLIIHKAKQNQIWKEYVRALHGRALIGELYQFSHRTIERLESAMVEAKRFNEWYEHSQIALNLAKMYEQQKDISEAINTLNVIEFLKLPANERVDVYDKLAELTYEIRDYHKVVDIRRKRLETTLIVGEFKQIALAHLDYAEALGYVEEYKIAHEHIDASLAIDSNPDSKSSALILRLQLLLMQRKTRVARRVFLETVDYGDKNGIIDLKVSVHSMMAQYFWERKKLREVVQYYLNYIMLALTNNNQDTEATTNTLAAIWADWVSMLSNSIINGEAKHVSKLYTLLISAISRESDHNTRLLFVMPFETVLGVLDKNPDSVKDKQRFIRLVSHEVTRVYLGIAS